LAEEARPSYRKVLSNTSTSFLWLGELISQSGDYVFAIALPWLVLLKTGSPFWVAVTNAAAWTPLLLSFVAGVYVDRTNRKTSVILGNVVQGAAAVSIAILYAGGILALPVLLALVFVLYFFDQFVSTAITAMIPKMAESRGALTAINALFSISSSTNRIVGYVISGAVIAVLGVAVPVLYDGATFFFAALVTLAFVSSLYGTVQNASADNAEPGSRKRAFRVEFVEGARFVRNSRLLLELTLVVVVANFFTGGMSALIAPYVANSLHLGSLGFGVVVSSLGAGGIIGSYVFGKMNVGSYVGKLFFAMALLDGVALVALGLLPVFYLALLMFFVFGLAGALIDLPINTLIQAKVPNQILGRVFTVLVTLMNAAAPVAAVFAGSFALTTSTHTIFVYFGLGVVVTVLLSYTSFGELRTARY
jgi:MFS family permease